MLGRREDEEKTTGCAGEHFLDLCDANAPWSNVRLRGSRWRRHTRLASSVPRRVRLDPLGHDLQVGPQKIKPPDLARLQFELLREARQLRAESVVPAPDGRRASSPCANVLGRQRRPHRLDRTLRIVAVRPRVLAGQVTQRDLVLEARAAHEQEVPPSLWPVPDRPQRQAALEGHVAWPCRPPTWPRWLSLKVPTRRHRANAPTPFKCCPPPSSMRNTCD